MQSPRLTPSPAGGAAPHGAPEFDAHSARYEQLIDEPLKLLLGGEESDYYVRLKADELITALRRRGIDPARAAVLDVGSGTGRMAQLLAPRVGSVRGVEPSPGMLERASALGLPEGTFVRGSGAALPFPDATFDVVFASCIFHHIDGTDHAQVAAEMRRVLRPGGWAFVFEHNPWNPLTRWVVARCPVDVGVTLHSAPTMERLWRGAGLHEVHARFIVFVPGALSALRPLEARLARVPLGGQFYVAGQAPKRGGPGAAPC